MAVVGTDAVELFARRALPGTPTSREAARPASASFGLDLSRASEAAKARDATASRLRQQDQPVRRQDEAARATRVATGTMAGTDRGAAAPRQERPEPRREAAVTNRSDAPTRSDAATTPKSDSAKPGRSPAKADASPETGPAADTPEAADIREGAADRKAAEAAAAADLADGAQSLAAADAVVGSGLADPAAEEDEPKSEPEPGAAVPPGLFGAIVPLPQPPATAPGVPTPANATATAPEDAGIAGPSGAKPADPIGAAAGDRPAAAGSVAVSAGHVARDAKASGDGASPAPVEAGAQPKPDFAASLSDPLVPPPAADAARDAVKAAAVPAAAHAATPVADRAGPQNASPPVPLGQVPMTIGLRSLAGSSQFEIRLDPADLGRIDVKLDIDKERGTVMTHLVVERVETLAMLQRDAGSLQQALAQAGLDPSEGGINLSLRGDGAGGQGSAERDGQPRSAPRSVQDSETRTTLDAAPLRALRSLGGLDIRI